MSMIEYNHLHRDALRRVAYVNLTQNTTYNHRGTAPESVFSDLERGSLIVILDDQTCFLTGLGAQVLKGWYEAGLIPSVTNEPTDFTLESLDAYAREWRSLKAQVTQQFEALHKDD